MNNDTKKKIFSVQAIDLTKKQIARKDNKVKQRCRTKIKKRTRVGVSKNPLKK